MKGYEKMKDYLYITYKDNFLKDFSEDSLRRCILWDRKKSGLGQVFYESLSEIQNTLNLIIQELNLKVDRNIPYLVVDCLEYVTERTRIFVRDRDEFDDKNILLSIDGMLDNFTNISHNIDCFQAAGRAMIENRNNSTTPLRHIDVTIFFDNIIRDLTIIDILLDIAYFNSYSFLRDLSIEEKKEFSKKKAKFFQEESLPTVFEEINSKDLDYYSLAFSCHKPNISDMSHYEYEIDIKKYIDTWNRFINSYYKDYVHKEISVKEQLKRRKNNHLPEDYYLNFENVSPGVYYVLRTEEKNIPQKYINQVLSIFGIKEKKDMSVSYLTYIKKDDFAKYVDLYKYAGISVFKIVVQ